MTHQEKIELLMKLRREGVIREECPERDFWRYSVIKLDRLPEELQMEYRRLGEIRW